MIHILAILNAVNAWCSLIYCLSFHISEPLSQLVLAVSNDGMFLDARYDDGPSTDDIKAGLTVDVGDGSGDKYSDKVYEGDEEIHRKVDLCSIRVNDIVAMAQFTDFQTLLMDVWTTMFSSMYHSSINNSFTSVVFPSWPILRLFYLRKALISTHELIS